MADNPLAALVTHGANGLDANHVPFEFDASQGEHGILRAHVARANPICQEIESGSDALIIFRERLVIYRRLFIRASRKHIGRCQLITIWSCTRMAGSRSADDETFVRGRGRAPHPKMEAGEAAPWKMGDAPVDFIQTMLQAIVGIEIEVTRLVGKAKTEPEQGGGRPDRCDQPACASAKQTPRQRSPTPCSTRLLLLKIRLDLPIIGMSILVTSS